MLALRRAALAPFGFALRAARDAPDRAETLGIDVRKVLWVAFSAGGLFGGLAGALQAFQKGAVFPNAISIPVSVDALVMVLLGGLQTLSGPIVGAVVYHGLATELTRAPRLLEARAWRWRSSLLVIAFPAGHRRQAARAHGEARA